MTITTSTCIMLLLLCWERSISLRPFQLLQEFPELTSFASSPANDYGCQSTFQPHLQLFPLESYYYTLHFNIN
jgi:hypothetical protein